MKKVISLFLSLAMLLSIVSVVDFSAYASVKTGKCGDNVTYSLDTETGVLTISGTGEMKGYYNRNSPFLENSNIKSVIIGNSVTSIGYGAFYGCTRLTSVTIGDSVTSIDSYAFYGCTRLTNVTMPDSVRSIGNSAFEGCTSLTSVTIGNSVTSIGGSAFSGCTSLVSVTISDSVTVIVASAFEGCISLISIEVSSDNKNYASVDGVLFNKDKLKLITYPAGKTDSEYAIPNSVTSIGYGTFEDCTSLISVTIPDSVTSIDNKAFYNCISLTSITIPNSVTEIGKDAFYNCTSLAKVDYNGTISQWKSISGYNNVSKIIKCTDGVIGNRNIVIIDNLEYQLYNDNTAYIFRYVNKTKTFKIPESVTYEGYSFNVTSISSQAFWGCTSLTSLTIPNSITSIDSDAFYNCSNLKFVIYNGTKTQWNAISISNSYNSYLTGAIIKCTDGIIGNGNTVTIDNLKYQLNNDQTASLVGYTASPENLVIPENISYEGYTLNVTSIGEFAFSGCTSLTSITIPYSVTTIDNNAFNGCTSLTSIDYNGTVSQWKSIKGYGNVSKIIKCTDGIISNGNTVTVDSVKYRLNDDYTAEVTDYSGTSGNITIPESVTYEGLTFKVTSIGSSAFNNCSSLTSVTIPNSIESIGDNAFNGCSKLKKIEIPDSVTYIGSKAFYGTAFYNTVKNWEDGVLYCGNHLISAKSDVTKITVKASTVSIAAGALDNCKSLEKINVLNPKCVINCTIPKTAVIGGAEGSTAEEFAQKNNMSIDYFEECTHSDKVQVVIAATCTEQGAVQSRCADCDKLISQTFTAPLGHTMVITTPAKAPTCTTSGNTQAGYCTVCGYNEVSTVIPATGHNFVNNSANCLACGVANPNYVAPTQPTPSPTPSTTPTQPTPSPTPSTTPTQPNQNDTNTSNDENVTVISKPKSASIKKVKGAKKAVSVEWKKVSGVKGYQVQVATNKKFKKNKKTVTIKKQKTTKTTVKKLKAKKKYYVRVRTYKIVNGKKVYSSWSKVKTVKTK